MFSPPIRKPRSAPSAVQTTREAFLQPKLTINAPGDQYEQEADTLAERVAQTPQGTGPVSGADGVASVQRQADDREEEPVQRKCSDCEKEEKERVQRQEKEPEEEPVQRQPEKKEEEKPPVQMMPLMRKSAGGGYTATPALSSRLSASKGGGSALPAPTRAHMESAFGADFSRVRIHTDSRAAEMNTGINARAFTHGSDIYFNSGQYAPESGEGKRLLAHELTHTMQQQRQGYLRDNAGVIQTQPKPTQEKSIGQISAKLLQPYFQKFLQEWKIKKPIADALAEGYLKDYPITLIPIKGKRNYLYSEKQVVDYVPAKTNKDLISTAIQENINLKKGKNVSDWTWSWKDNPTERNKTREEIGVEVASFTADETGKELLKLEIEAYVLLSKEVAATITAAATIASSEVLIPATFAAILVFSIVELYNSITEPVEIELTTNQQIAKDVKDWLKNREAIKNYIPPEIPRIAKDNTIVKGWNNKY